MMDSPNLRWLQWGKGSTSTTHLSSYVVDGLPDSFDGEIILDDDYVWNYDDGGELSNKAGHESGIIFGKYWDTGNEKSYSMKLEEEQCTVLPM